VSRQGAEPKPPWSAVPREIKDEVARVLRSPVARRFDLPQPRWLDAVAD